MSLTEYAAKPREIAAGMVGDSIEALNASWSFGGNTPRVFEGHVAKSVPLYAHGHDLVVGLSDFFLSRNSLCYEIGSSTGLLISKVVRHNRSKNIRAVGIDVEPSMTEFSNSKYSDSQVSFVNGDIVELELEKADMIIAYYTMQFIKPKHRLEVLSKIYSSLNWSGALVLFEKVRAPDARFQDIMTSVYTDYKLNAGYNPEEVLSKSRSLKGVLEPFSTNGNLDLLQKAGFQDVMSIMKWVCFEGFLAIK
jgi:tRNA (cmo5U34)-methyltransferase